MSSSSNDGTHREYSLEQLIRMFEPGIVLWRGCKFDQAGRPYLEQSEFRTSDRGNRFMARALVDRGGFLYEPTIVAQRQRRGQSDVGIIVMLDDIPPPNWTHLICGGVGNKQTSIRAYYDGTQLEPEEYLEFRRRSMAEWIRTARMPIEDRIAGARSIRVDGLLHESRRLLTAFDARTNRFRVEPFDPGAPAPEPVILGMRAHNTC